MTLGVGGWLSFWFSSSLERARPVIAEETLRRQNYLNSKRDAYYEAIDVITRHMNASDLSPSPEGRSGIGGNITESEINAAKAKLALYAASASVVQYDSFFSETPNAVRTFAQFIELARVDMGYTAEPLPYRYIYLFQVTQP